MAETKKTKGGIFIILILAVALIFWVRGCPPPPTNELAGEWAPINGSSGIAVFNLDGSFTFTTKIPESNGNTRDQIESGRYELDFTKEPAWLDFIYKDSYGNDGRRETIIKFNSDKEMVIVLGMPTNTRPVSFQSSAITFRRLKQF